MAKRSKAVREIDAMMHEATRQLADLDASRQAVAARLDTLGKLAAKLERAPVVKKPKARLAEISKAAFEKMRAAAGKTDALTMGIIPEGLKPVLKPVD